MGWVHCAVNSTPEDTAAEHLRASLNVNGLVKKEGARAFLPFFAPFQFIPFEI